MISKILFEPRTQAFSGPMLSFYNSKGNFLEKHMSIISFKNADIDFEKIDENNPYFHVISALKSHHKKLEGLKILDVGCGRERKYQILCRLLANDGCDVTGIDIDCRNEKISENLKFIRCAAEDIDKKLKERFDVIISSYFFGYVTADWSMENGSSVKEYEKSVMKKIYDLLVENGISIHYMHESWSLNRDDLESLGFEIVALPEFKEINPLKDGLCIVKKIAF